MRRPSADPQIQTTRPTLAWQDKLSARLMGTPSSGSRTLSQSASQSPRTARSPSEFSVDDLDSEPPRTKRRLEGPSRLILTASYDAAPHPASASSATEMSVAAKGAFGSTSALSSERYAHPSSRWTALTDSEGDDLGDCADAFGNLSIDENREVRGRLLQSV